MIPVELFSSGSPARCCRVMLLSQVLVLVPSFSTTSLPEPGRCFHSHRLAAMRRTRAGGEALPVLLGPSHPPAMCWKSKKKNKKKLVLRCKWDVVESGERKGPTFLTPLQEQAPSTSMTSPAGDWQREGSSPIHEVFGAP